MKAQRAQKTSFSTTEAQQALVARVLASSQLARSTRLRDFLQYVAEHAIANSDVPIHESEIAEHVFGRNTSQGSDDSIVRVHASQLRKRLEQYFDTEGASEELIIEIPKGNYTPVFKSRHLEPPPEVLAPSPPPKSPRPKLLLGALALASIAAMFLIWDDLRMRAAASASAGPYQKRFWSELLDSPLACNIVLADSGFGYLRDLSQIDISVDQYANRDFQPMIDALPVKSGLRDWASMLVHRRFTSIGDVTIGRKIASLAGNRADRLQVILARDFSPARLKTENVILIGSRYSNPWAELVESQLNFQYAFESGSTTQIRNLKPLAGEQAVYQAEEASGHRIPGGFSVVARLSQPGGKGKIVLIAGTESEGTEAGGDSVLNEASLAQLHKALGASAAEPFPDFEVLLSTTRVGGSSPTTRVIAVRRH